MVSYFILVAVNANPISDELKAKILVQRALVTASRKVNKNFIKRRQHLYKTYVKPDFSINHTDKRQDVYTLDVSPQYQTVLHDMYTESLPTRRSKQNSVQTIDQRDHNEILPMTPIPMHAMHEAPSHIQHAMHVDPCTKPCIVEHVVSKEELLQEAASLKESSKLLDQKAKALENVAKIEFGKSQQNLKNDNKVDHIKSGKNGKGPERGGSSSELPFKKPQGYSLPMGLTSDSQDDMGVEPQQMGTGYPVSNIPVRPLPPVMGPNPYEILTTSSLGNNAGAVPDGASTPGAKSAPDLKFVVSIKGLKKKKPAKGKKRDIKNNSKRHRHTRLGSKPRKRKRGKRNHKSKKKKSSKKSK